MFPLFLEPNRRENITGEIGCSGYLYRSLVHRFAASSVRQLVHCLFLHPLSIASVTNKPDRSPGAVMIRSASSFIPYLAPQVRLTLEGAPCIWTGAGFVAAADAALATPADFAPYLQAVPPELAQHKDLLLALGVRSLASEGYHIGH